MTTTQQPAVSLDPLERWAAANDYKFPSHFWDDCLSGPRPWELPPWAPDEESEGEPQRKPLKRYSLDELARKFPDLKPPVVDGLFRKGEVVNINASPKAGKSWLGIGLALSVAVGSPWLGFEVNGGRVLLIDNEVEPANVWQRITRVAEAMGLHQAEREGLDAMLEHYAEARAKYPGEDFLTDDQIRELHFEESYREAIEVVSLRGDLRTIEAVAEELMAIELGEFGLVILDAKYRFLSEHDGTGTENDNVSQARFYNLMDKVAAAMDAAIVLIHHATKGSQADKRVTDVGAGGGAQSRAADCHLVLREHEFPGHAVLDAAVRSFPPVDRRVLRWDWPLWHVAEGVDARLKGKSLRDDHQAEKDREGELAIVKALGHLKRATRSQLRTEVGMGSDRLNKLLAAMLERADVERETTTIRGNQTDEFFLPNTPNE